MPIAASCAKERSGLPIPASACTPVPASAEAVAVIRESSTRTNVSPVSVIVNAPRGIAGAAASSATSATTASTSSSRDTGSRNGPGREEPAVPRRTGRIDDRDLDIARQPIVLKAVVSEDDVALRVPGQQVARGCDTIARDDDRVAGARQEQRLVADATRIVVRRDGHRRAVACNSAVAATDDAGTKAALRERIRERRDQRRLAASAGGDVADDDDRDGKPHRAQNTPAVQRAPERNRTAEQDRQRAECQCEQRGSRRVPCGDQAIGKRHGIRTAGALQTVIGAAGTGSRT